MFRLSKEEQDMAEKAEVALNLQAASESKEKEGSSTAEKTARELRAVTKCFIEKYCNEYLTGYKLVYTSESGIVKMSDDELLRAQRLNISVEEAANIKAAKIKALKTDVLKLNIEEEEEGSNSQQDHHMSEC